MSKAFVRENELTVVRSENVPYHLPAGGPRRLSQAETCIVLLVTTATVVATKLDAQQNKGTRLYHPQ